MKDIDSLIEHKTDRKRNREDVDRHVIVGQKRNEKVNEKDRKEIGK